MGQHIGATNYTRSINLPIIITKWRRLSQTGEIPLRSVGHLHSNDSNSGNAALQRTHN